MASFWLYFSNDLSELTDRGFWIDRTDSSGVISRLFSAVRINKAAFVMGLNSSTRMASPISLLASEAIVRTELSRRALFKKACIGLYVTRGRIR
ncbi:hypothetical protein D3C78_1748030 [compost metagenome]